MKSYVARSPTRVDLAGGTLDLWPICTFYAPCVTVNVAINVFTQAELKKRSDSKVRLLIQDLKLEKNYSTLAECLSDTDESVKLLQTILAYWKPDFGFELTTQSESPIGGGLGGSSSLCISILKVFRECMERNLSDQEMVVLASNLEAQILGVPTGTQDYYPALRGGLNIIEFDVQGPNWKTPSLDPQRFQKHFLLVYTGRPHQSGLNNWEVLKQTIQKNEITRKALADLKNVSAEMAEHIQKPDWSHIPTLLKREYDARIRLSPVFSSPEIERLKNISFEAGAEAVKICGAGGGGCVLVWCPEGVRSKISKECSSNGFQVLESAQPV